MTAYYNEIDKYAAQWLRNLIDAGHIAPGIVDERSIEDVYPSDLKGFTQCHFFAGIGVWSYALRRAGWPDDRPVWTGSCPCQPFSSAGKGAGFADERHLWPSWLHLIKECKPAALFGEQVASADAGPWLDLVQDDLEALGYAFGAVPFPSAGVGAPHIRDRLFWMADAGDRQRNGFTVFRGHERDRENTGRSQGGCEPQPCGNDGRLGHAERLSAGRDAGAGAGTEGGTAVRSVGDNAGSPGAARGLGHDERAELALGQWIAGIPGGTSGADAGEAAERAGIHAASRPGPTNGLWRAADWLLCRDGKWRPVEPGTFPLAHGAPARVGRLRAYGNAINAEAAIAFIKAAA